MNISSLLVEPLLALYIFKFKINISKYFSVLIGIAIGIFYGLFASALAEVLNVMPVFAKKI